MNCVFCNRKILNKGSLKAHELSCRSNPNKVTHKRSPKAGRQKGCNAWNKGLRGVQVAWNKGKTGLKGTPHTEEWKKQQSERKKILYASGWEPVCGRSKKYDYDSPISGIILVDGRWELSVAK